MKATLPPEPGSGSVTVTIPHEQFNPIRLALLRLGSPLQTVLGARNLQLQLTLDAWVCFDRRLGSQPALAWTDFEIPRNRLAAPVFARVLFYNSYAKAFANSVLPELAERMSQQVRETCGCGARIVAFPHRRR